MSTSTAIIAATNTILTAFPNTGSDSPDLIASALTLLPLVTALASSFITWGALNQQIKELRSDALDFEARLRALETERIPLAERLARIELKLDDVRFAMRLVADITPASEKKP